MRSKTKEYISFLIIVFFDFISFVLSLYLAHQTRIFLNIFNIVQYKKHFSYYYEYFFVFFIVFFLFYYEGVYTKRYDVWEDLKKIFNSLTIIVIIILSLVSITKSSLLFSRLLIFLFWFYGLLLFPLLHFFSKKILYILKLWQKKVIICGVCEQALDFSKSLDNQFYLGYKTLAFFDNKSSLKTLNEQKVIRSFIELSQEAKSNDIDTVFVITSCNIKIDLTTLQTIFKNVILIPDFEGLSIFNTKVNFYFSQKLLFIQTKNNLESLINKFLKRLFDLVLVVLAMPFFLIALIFISAAIKFTSKGPVFFKHERIGKNGITIKIYKFRSMYEDAQERLKNLLDSNEELRQEWNQYFKLKNDPRVTKVGNFLRKTSLDELPQIINIIKNEMSFVGPRPVVKEEVEKYYREYAKFYYMINPGLTGLWQVSGRNDTTYDFRVKMDSWYVTNWSLWLDIIIIVKTFGAVLKKEGVY